MDEHAFSGLQSLLDEDEGFVGYDITLIKDDLAISINPVVSQIGYANALPMVRNLATRTIDDACHLVGNNELQILRRQLITDKEPILDLDSPQDLTTSWKASHYPATAARLFGHLQ